MRPSSLLVGCVHSLARAGTMKPIRCSSVANSGRFYKGLCGAALVLPFLGVIAIQMV